MKVLLWLLAGILILDVGLVIVVGVCAAFVRRRRPRAMRDPVTWWPLEFERDAPATAHGPTVVPLRRRLVSAPALAARERRGSGHRTLAAGLVAAAILAGTAFANPQIRHLVTTAFDTVTGARTEAQEPDAGEQPEAGGSTTAPDGSAGPDGRTHPSDGGGDGASPGPAVDPRPPGEPHGGIVVPVAPPSVTANASSSSQVDLWWADVGGETGFRIERALDAGGPWEAVGVTGSGETSWSDTGLSPGTTFFYRIVATNAAGDAPPSDVASATTSVDPASPTTVTAVAVSSTQIDLVWTDVSNESGYRVERSDGAGGWTTVATAGQGVTSSSDSGLEPGTTYAYRVFATNAAGDSAPSDVASATTWADGVGVGGGDSGSEADPTPVDGDPHDPARLAAGTGRVR